MGVKIVLGTPVGVVPKPWLYFPVEAVMVNALEADGDARARLGFEGELWADSGGFQIMRRGLSASTDAIARRYRRMGCDVCLSLDIPPLPGDPPEVAAEKAEASYRNWLALRREVPGVVPVVHVYPRRDLFLSWLRRYEDAEALAIGGAVPYVLTSRGVPPRSRLMAISLIAEARREFKGRLHVLGMGSPSVTPTLEALGVDSADSATWRIKAAYGKVLLPGGGERHVTGRAVKFGRHKADEEELEELQRFLAETGFPLLWDRERLGSFEYRALVNAWVLLKSRALPRSPAFEKLYLEARRLAHGAEALEEAE